MIANIYSVKDELTDKFHNPIFIPDSNTSESEATRIFRSQMKNTQLWRDNPSDFSLHYLGAIDDSNGVIKSEIKKIIDGRAVLNE